MFMCRDFDTNMVTPCSPDFMNREIGMNSFATVAIILTEHYVEGLCLAVCLSDDSL